MPLVTRTSAQSYVYKQAAAPTSGMATGDVWIDTDNGVISTYSGSAWVQQTAGALGSASTVLKVNSGGTALEYGTEKGVWAKAAYATLGSANAVISSGTFTAANEIMVIAHLRASTGTHGGRVRFGTAGTYDTGNNYSHANFNAGVYETAGTQSAALVWSNTVVNEAYLVSLHIVNYAAVAKIATGTSTLTGISGSSASVGWNNTTNQITDIQFRADIDGGTGQTFGAGSVIEVYTRNFND